VAESSNKMLPLIFLMLSSILGMVGAFFIKKIDTQTSAEDESEDIH
jgi:hypothetical protein